MAKLALRTTTERKTLEKLAQERLRDFRALRKAHRFAAAIYLGVYAVECLLKACICKTLDLSALPATYQSHDLMALLLHSGLKRRIENEPDVYENLKKLAGLWHPAQEDKSVRYIDDPKRYGETTATDVNRWLCSKNDCVTKWLKNQL